MTLDCSILSYNLPSLCIYAESLKSEGEAPEELIANWAGTHIYRTSHAWGKIWKVIYAIIGLFIGGTIKEKKLAEALRKTHEVFNEQLQVIKIALEEYEGFLKQAGNGKVIDDKNPLDSDDYHIARNELDEWRVTTSEFCSLIENKQHKAISQLYQTHLGINEEGFLNLFQSDLIARSKICDQVMELEGQLSGSLPLQELSTIPTERASEFDIQNEQIKKFFKAIHDKDISVNAIHKALQNLMHFVKCDDKHKGLVRLENALYCVETQILKAAGKLDTIKNHNLGRFQESNKRVSVFLEIDDEHLAWRRQHVKGYEIRYVSDTISKQLTLDEEIGIKKSGINRNRFFKIKDHPDMLLWVTCNEVMLGMKKSIYEDYNEMNIPKSSPRKLRLSSPEKTTRAPNPFLPIVQIDFDKSGRYALVEHLKLPLENTKWDPRIKEFGSNHTCQYVLQLIKTFIAKDETPTPLLPKYLMFSKEGVIKSTRVLTKGKFNFHALERLIIGFSQKYMPAYCYLMTESGLFNHKCSTFYRTMFESAAKGELADAFIKAASEGSGINNAEVIEQGRKLYKKVFDIRTKCFELISDVIERHKIKEIKEFLEQKINSCYNKTIGTEKGGASFIWESFQKEIIDEVRKKYIPHGISSP